MELSREKTDNAYAEIMGKKIGEGKKEDDSYFRAKELGKKVELVEEELEQAVASISQLKNEVGNRNSLIRELYSQISLDAIEKTRLVQQSKKLFDYKFKLIGIEKGRKGRMKSSTINH